MEFPELGIHCSIKECKTLDFLPIECSHCHSVYCKEHAQPLKHKCVAFVDKVVVEKKVSYKNKYTFP